MEGFPDYCSERKQEEKDRFITALSEMLDKNADVTINVIEQLAQRYGYSNLSDAINRLCKHSLDDPYSLGHRMMDTIVLEHERFSLAIALLQTHPNILADMNSTWLVEFLQDDVVWKKDAKPFLTELAKHKLPTLTFVTLKRLVEGLEPETHKDVLFRMRQLGMILDPVWKRWEAHYGLTNTN